MIIYTIIGILIVLAIIKIYQIKKEKKEIAQQEQEKKRKKESDKNPKKIYEKKQLMTKTEIKYFHAIKNNTPEGYIVLPQINLATIINRTDEHKYQNELYRNIDFVIFDNTLSPIVLIEINDDTHKEKSRWMRDQKVKHICEEANLPIITLWTEYGIKPEYIKKRIEEHCKISA